MAGNRPKATVVTVLENVQHNLVGFSMAEGAYSVYALKDRA